MNTDIKLVALDLDRTTLNSESHLSEVNRQALIDAISNGVHVCIASGRAFDTLPEDVISVPGIEYAITSNGAAIYRIAGKECLKSYVLTPYFSGCAVYSVEAKACPFINASYVTISFSVSLSIVFTDSGVRT